MNAPNAYEQEIKEFRDRLSNQQEGGTLKPKEVYVVLKNIGATHLHHANSVKTSVSFLKEGALLSRGYVEDHKLEQTAQPSSDDKDKRYKIWHRVFVDHVDIHERGGRKKGPNQYGPVLFKSKLELLLQLPEGSDVKVTKHNPIYWTDKDSDADRWYQSKEELEKDIHFGDFEKMLVIETPSGRVDFSKKEAVIVLDNPKRKMSNGEDAHTHAKKRLEQAADKGNVKLTFEKRECKDGCKCVETYGKQATNKVDEFFG